MTQLGENSVKGTEFKVRISMTPIDNRSGDEIALDFITKHNLKVT
jgi:hypothetical protein